MKTKQEQYQAMIETIIGDTKIAINRQERRNLAAILTECISDIITLEKICSSNEPVVPKMQKIFTITLVFQRLDNGLPINPGSRYAIPFGLN